MKSYRFAHCPKLFALEDKAENILIRIPLSRNYRFAPILLYPASDENSSFSTIASRIMGVAYRLGFKPKSRTLLYKRIFIQCPDGPTTFLASAYPGIKRLADLIDRSDSHILICKPKDAAFNPAETPAPSSPQP